MSVKNAAAPVRAAGALLRTALHDFEGQQ